MSWSLTNITIDGDIYIVHQEIADYFQKLEAEVKKLKYDENEHFTKVILGLEAELQAAQDHAASMEQSCRELEAEVDSEKRRADQLGINCRWLIEIVDFAHTVLCKGQNGSWQDRAKQLKNTLSGRKENGDE